MTDISTHLTKLQALLKQSLITQEEFDSQKKALLDAEFRTGGIMSSGSPQGTALSLSAGMSIGPDNNRLFRLEKKLGGGAMGEVWKAKDEAESKIVGHPVWVAVKALIPFLSAGERHREALKREAINAKKLSHAHIIRTHDWYEDKVGGFPFLVMEYLEGQTLDQKLAQAGHFTYAETLAILKPIVEALSYAWEEHHIIHRDLKPDNIYLTAEGKLKLLDFGIAAQVRNTASAVGLAGFDSPGTLGYAPPEAGSNRKADPRSDIYSLGILSYELLEGQLPFNGLRQATTRLPEKPEALNEAQWQVLQKAMAFEVEKRYSSEKEFWRALQGANGPSAEEIESQKQEEAAAKAAAAEKAARKAKEEAEEREDVSQWQQARQQDTEQAYHGYLSQSQRLAYKKSALERITELKQEGEQERTRKVAQEKQEAEKREAMRKETERKGAEARKAQQEAQAELERSRCAAEEAKRQGVATQSKQPSGKKFPLGGLVVGIVVVIGLVLVIGRGKKEDSVDVSAFSAPALAPAPPAAPAPQPTSPAPSFRPGQIFKDCAECPEMVVIPAGRFLMGSPADDPGRNSNEEPQHEVRVAAFALGKTEVTQGLWRTVMGNNSSYFKLCSDDCPVEQVSWDETQAFVAKLSAKTGQRYRLPSEAEWEYACRAGGKERYCGSNDLGAVAWYSDNSDADEHRRMGGRKQANAWGLHDMSGNVAEWVEDCWNENYQGTPQDGSAWKSGIYCESSRVKRGGSWYSKPDVARAAGRSGSVKSMRNFGHGFRLARMLP